MTGDLRYFGNESTQPGPWDECPEMGSLPTKLAVRLSLDMLLFAGPLSAVTTNVDAAPWQQHPHLWWPRDRAWAVATDTDLMSTYVAGTDECIAAADVTARVAEWPSSATS